MQLCLNWRLTARTLKLLDSGKARRLSTFHRHRHRQLAEPFELCMHACEPCAELCRACCRAGPLGAGACLPHAFRRAQAEQATCQTNSALPDGNGWSTGSAWLLQRLTHGCCFAVVAGLRLSPTASKPSVACRLVMLISGLLGGMGMENWEGGWRLRMGRGRKWVADACEWALSWPLSPAS